VLGKLATELRTSVAWHGHEAGIEQAIGAFVGRVQFFIYFLDKSLSLPVHILTELDISLSVRSACPVHTPHTGTYSFV